MSTKKNMIPVANLDENDVYLGIVQIPENDLQDHHFRLDDGCDLDAGKYKLDREHGTFVPLHVPDAAKDMPPDALDAIALGLAAAHIGGIAMPQQTLDWLDFYFASFDGRGRRRVPIVKSFINRNKG